MGLFSGGNSSTKVKNEYSDVAQQGSLQSGVEGNAYGDSHNISGVSAGTYGDVNLTSVGTDYGAIDKAFLLATNALESGSQNALKVSEQAVAQQNKILSTYFDNYNDTQKAAFDLAANSSGMSSTNDKLMMTGALLAVVFVVMRLKK